MTLATCQRAVVGGKTASHQHLQARTHLLHSTVTNVRFGAAAKTVTSATLSDQCLLPQPAGLAAAMSGSCALLAVSGRLVHGDSSAATCIGV